MKNDAQYWETEYGEDIWKLLYSDERIPIECLEKNEWRSTWRKVTVNASTVEEYIEV